MAPETLWCFVLTGKTISSHNSDGTLNAVQYISNRDVRKRLSEKDCSIAELTAANDDLSRINSEQRDTIQSQQATIVCFWGNRLAMRIERFK